MHGLCISFSQERYRSCPPEALQHNSMREERRVDVMSTLVKEVQAILHFQDQPRGQCIGTTQEVVWTSIQR
jgi:hypothetical protein